MIQRNRGNADQVLSRIEEGVDPDLALLDIGQDIAVREHRPLGDTGGATGVLQESKILRVDRHRSEFSSGSHGQDVPELHATRQIKGLDRMFQMLDDEVADQPFDPRHHVG